MNTSYQHWLSSLGLDLLREETPVSLPDEIELQSLWYQGAFGLNFKTSDGLPVKIEYLGEWNHSSGPDFLECVISLNGKQIKGSIELDLTSAHWEIHKHCVNPAFDDVILHISFASTHSTTFCRNTKNKAIPQVLIPREILIKALEMKPNLDLETIPGFCAEEFENWTTDEVQLLIKEASKHRLHQKALRLGRQIRAIGIYETLWQSLATTLGYAPNQLGMRHLSQKIKAKELSKYKHTDTHLSLLLGTSQFISPELHKKAPNETQNYIQSLWKEWWRYRQCYELDNNRSIVWKMHGQRPINHPHRRVAALGILFQHLPKIVDTATTPNPQKLAELKQTLCQTKDDFWSQHFTLTSEKSGKNLSLFGEDKFREFLNNFIIPIWYLDDQDSAFSFYSKKRSRTQNSEVRKALGRLFPSHPAKMDLVKFSYQHQGLQQLYRDFCLKSGCLQCPFPKLDAYLKLPTKSND